ncbi:MAG: cell envelope integrity protein TolA [Alphaproteobacteria bacterium]|nr:cell envelope integrity protein TolA [Alphaproteobacteria bacterium]
MPTESPEPPPTETAQAAPAPEPAPAPPPPPSRFDDMLRDLSERTPAPPGPEEPPTKLEDTIEQLAALEPSPTPLTSETPEQRFTRARIYGLIQRQIQANWRRPPALQEVDDMAVILEFQLQPDGTIHDLQISETELDRVDRNTLLRPLLDSAQAAILRTGKITGLPPEDYALWRRVRLNFRPQR